MSDDVAPAKRKRGRPRLPPGPTARNNFTFRMRAGMREWLRAEAEASERSMSEQVEWILNEHYRSAKRLPFESAVIVALASLQDSIHQRWPRTG